jgi:hypothetical protein
MEKLLSFGTTDLLGGEFLSYSLASQDSQFLGFQTISANNKVHVQQKGTM